jgi:amino acid transporter
MIGSAIFVSILLVLSGMGGPQAFLGWSLGMIIALAHGLVWAELGVAMPAGGGTYVYLEEAFGRGRAGRLMSFIFPWGSAISFPLISAFIAVSFSQYARYLCGSRGLEIPRICLSAGIRDFTFTPRFSGRRLPEFRICNSLQLN